MLTRYITEVNEQLMRGGEVWFPAPNGEVGLLEALLLKCKKRSLLRFASRREIRIGKRVYHVYRL